MEGGVAGGTGSSILETKGAVVAGYTHWCRPKMHRVHDGFNSSHFARGQSIIDNCLGRKIHTFFLRRLHSTHPPLDFRCGRRVVLLVALL